MTKLRGRSDAVIRAAGLLLACCATGVQLLLQSLQESLGLRKHAAVVLLAILWGIFSFCQGDLSKYAQ